MKDINDNATNELSLSVKRSRGRPGKTITEDNYYHVLSYFGKKKYLDNKQQIGIKAIVLASPAIKKTTAFLKTKISTQEKYLSDLIKRRMGFGSESFDLHIDKDDFFRRNADDISLAETTLKNLRKQAQELPSTQNISDLQQWVIRYIDQEEWTRCLNLRSQEKASKSKAKKKIGIDHKQYLELAKLKEDLKAATWSDALAKMAYYTRKALTEDL